MQTQALNSTHYFYRINVAVSHPTARYRQELGCLYACAIVSLSFPPCHVCVWDGQGARNCFASTVFMSMFGASESKITYITEISKNDSFYNQNLFPNVCSFLVLTLTARILISSRVVVYLMRFSVLLPFPYVDTTLNWIMNMFRLKFLSMMFSVYFTEIIIFLPRVK
jgi:hypothetical protein